MALRVSSANKQNRHESVVLVYDTSEQNYFGGIRISTGPATTPETNERQGVLVGR